MESKMSFTTHNQVSLPNFIYGTAWKKNQTTSLVELAVQSGFKAIDTANQLIHYDEALVGDALKKLYSEGVTRDDLFLQTKFTPADGQDHRTPYDRKANVGTQVKQSMDSSLSHLHCENVDSYVLHGPYSRRGLTDSDWEVWTTMEELHQVGKTRIIGISNVMADQLDELCANAKVKPMVVQNRCYAIRGWDSDVREICRRENIIYQGFSLLTANTGVMSHPFVRSVATRLGATPAQVIFRFSMQVGMLPLTGTTNAQHMKEDLASESFALTAEEVKTIETIAV